MKGDDEGLVHLSWKGARSCFCWPGIEEILDPNVSCDAEEQGRMAWEHGFIAEESCLPLCQLGNWVLVILKFTVDLLCSACCNPQKLR